MFESSAVTVGVSDPADLDDAALLDGFEDLLRAEARIRAEQARWLRAIDAREATVAECGRPTRSWLIEELRLTPAEARRRLLLARVLTSLPVTEAAFADGDISADHALTLAKSVMDASPESRPALEDALVALAREAAPQDVARAVDEVRSRLGADEPADVAARRYAERGVDLETTLGGYTSLAGTLAPDVAEALRVAVNAAATKAGPEDERSLRQRRHDALGEIAAFYLSHASVPDDAGERPRVVVTIPYDALLRDLEDRVATFDTGVTISPETARRLACDAEVLPAVLGSRGEILDLGRTTRVFTTAIRRAAAVRDSGRCAFGGCRRPVRECHHVVWWSRGGHTSIDNAAWLCAFHHWLVHEGRWTMHAEADGYTFVDPGGCEHRFRRQPRAA